MKKNTGLMAGQGEYAGTVTFADIKNILQRSGPRNVTYQLAGQLASTELAMEAGYLSEDMLVFAPSLTRFGSATGGALAGNISLSGLISLGELTDAIITELRAHPFADEDDAWWVYQNTLQLVLESVNNQAIMQIGW